jgi:hypothetical protein
VFKAGTGCGGIGAYLDSFLLVSAETLQGLAAYFAASVAFKGALLSKNQGKPLPDELISLGKFSAGKAETTGLGRPKGEAAAVITLILEKAEKFETRSLFSRFLNFLLEQASLSQSRSTSSESDTNSPLPSVAYNELWKQCVNWAGTAAGLYNLRPADTLEKLFTDLSRGMAKL